MNTVLRNRVGARLGGDWRPNECRISHFRTCKCLVLSLIICALSVAYTSHHVEVLKGHSMGTASSHNSSFDDIQIFDLPPSYAEPSHMDPINPSILIPRGFVGIDIAHRTGSFHFGNIMFVTDSSERILLLKRSSELVTCPNTWSVVGEHRFRDEDPAETTRRGISEELGLHFWQDYVVENRNLTLHPLYYIREYGPSLGDRIDRQITYLWEVRLRDRWEDVRLSLDGEVAEHMWISVEEFERWLDGDKQSTDFCHHTIHVLLSFGIKRLKRLQGERTN